MLQLGLTREALEFLSLGSNAPDGKSVANGFLCLGFGLCPEVTYP